MSMPISETITSARERADAGNAAQHFDGDAKGFDVAVDLLIDAGDGRIHGIDLIQMQLAA